MKYIYLLPIITISFIAGFASNQWWHMPLQESIPSSHDNIATKTVAKTSQPLIKAAQVNTTQTNTQFDHYADESHSADVTYEEVSFQEIIDPLNLLWADLMEQYLQNDTTSLELREHKARFQLTNLALDNPPILDELLQRYQQENDPAMQEFLSTVLSDLRTPEVLALASDMAQGQSTEKQKSGFTLLSSLAMPLPEIRQLVMNTLQNSQDAELQSHAVSALTLDVVAPAERQGIEKQLDVLFSSDHPQLRAQSIIKIAEWQQGEHVINHINTALADESALVKLAAMTAISDNKLNDASIKALLLTLAEDKNEPDIIKAKAVNTLQRYSLNESEYETFIKLQAELEGINEDASVSQG